jgi:hypothetical protein
MNFLHLGASLKIPSRWNPLSCVHSRSLSVISTCFFFWIDDFPRVTSALIHSNEQMCLYVKGCEWQSPISPAMASHARKRKNFASIKFMWHVDNVIKNKSINNLLVQVWLLWDRCVALCKLALYIFSFILWFPLWIPWLKLRMHEIFYSQSMIPPTQQAT